MKHTIACILFAALLMQLMACSNSEGSPESENIGETPATTQVEETVASTYLDAIPAVDLGGMTMNTLVREECEDEFSADLTGDVIDEAVYNRNLTIEERFSCVLTYTPQPGSWDHASTFQDTIRSTVMTGDATYDLVTGQSNIIQPLNQEGVFVNFLDEENLDLSKPYWVDSYTNGINLAGKVCTLCGDFALSSFSQANVIFFNKSVMDDYGMEYPYDLALEGNWTLTKMLTMAEDVTTDINGDGTLQVADDLLGLCAYNNSVQPFFSACGLEYTEMGSDGKRQLRTPSDAMVEIADTVNNFCHGTSFVNANTSFDNQGGVLGLEPLMAESFMEGKYLFMGMVLQGIEYLRDMEVDFGILPYPKAEESQNEYRTTILRRYTVAAIPSTASDSGNSALILEAMAAEGYDKIIPKYYEIALKNKYIRDESSSQVLDLIKSSLYLEFADLYYTDLGGMSDFFAGYVMDSKAGTFASSWEKNSKAWSAKLEKLYEVNA